MVVGMMGARILTLSFAWRAAGGNFAKNSAPLLKPLLTRFGMVAVAVAIRTGTLRRSCGDRGEAGEENEQSYRAPEADHGQ